MVNPEKLDEDNFKGRRKEKNIERVSEEDFVNQNDPKLRAKLESMKSKKIEHEKIRDDNNVLLGGMKSPSMRSKRLSISSYNKNKSDIYFIEEKDEAKVSMHKRLRKEPPNEIKILQKIQDGQERVYTLQRKKVARIELNQEIKEKRRQSCQSRNSSRNFSACLDQTQCNQEKRQSSSLSREQFNRDILSSRVLLG